MYKAKDYNYLFGLQGFGPKTVKTHISLYQAYVKNTNKLIKLIAELPEEDNPCFSELQRRFGWEFSGMRLHEYYFANLGPCPIGKAHAKLIEWIAHCFGGWDAWQAQFMATGLMRGIGWAILCRDNQTGRLFNSWIEQHNGGNLPGCQPLLVMDVWEHAYLCDYGLDRKAYIETFFANVNWDVVGERFEHIGM